MVQNMKVNGRMINKMEKEKKHGMMAHILKGIMRMEKRKEWVLLIGVIIHNMWVNSLKTAFMEMEFILGQMAEYMMEHG